ncbi:MAG: hypothetical protein JO300_01535 [Silvibacterium sp.]|nr:hypothetical protein [Silvibacterium sp.]
MRAKKTVKKQVVPTNRVATRTDEIRVRLAKLGINERDVLKAVAWARTEKVHRMNSEG